MQTDKVHAAYVENNDFIVQDGEVQGYVYSIREDGDLIVFDVVNDEAEHEDIAFAPFDTVTIVSSFLDEDSTSGEEVFIDV